jgi:ankyrin repeat protein
MSDNDSDNESNSSDNIETTDLQIACAENNLEKVKELLKYPETLDGINKQDKYGQTALMISCNNNNFEIVKELLKYPETLEGINLQDNYGETAILNATSSDNARSDDNRIVMELLNYPETFKGINLVDSSTYSTLLMIECAEINGYEVVKKLLEHPETLEGINFQDDEGLTALSIACQNSQLEIVQELLKYPETQEGISYTTVMIVCDSENDDVEILKELLKYPNTIKDVNIKGDDGNTSLMMACNRNNIEIIKELLKYPKTLEGINIQNDDGLTALSIVCKNSQLEIVQELLKYPETTQEEESLTSLTISLITVCDSEDDNVEILKELLKYPETLNCINRHLIIDGNSDSEGNTCLMTACNRNHFNQVKELLKYPETVDGINIRNKDGATALLLAYISPYTKPNEEREVILELLKYPETFKGINIKSSAGGYTALMFSCMGDVDDLKELAVMKELLKNPETLKGINLQSGDRETALIIACHNNNFDKVQELLKYPETLKGINLMSDNGTALMVACNFGFENDDILKELLKYPETLKGINLQDNNYGNTALMIACSLGLKRVQELLKYPQTLEGIELKNDDGETAIDIAKKNGHNDIVEYLSKFANPIKGKIKELLVYTNNESNINDKFWPKMKALEGTLFDVMDVEDSKNQEFLDKYSGNIIFMINKNNNYEAFGYPIEAIASNPNSDLFFQCKTDKRGRYKYNDITYSFGKTPILKIGLPTDGGQINYYLLLEDFVGALETGERVFLLESTNYTLMNTISYHVAKGFLKNTPYDITSADHCQSGTDKSISMIYVCYKSC